MENKVPDKLLNLFLNDRHQLSNPPDVVAKAMKNEVEKFRKSFKTIEFAVYCPPYDDTNYRVFKRVLETI